MTIISRALERCRTRDDGFTLVEGMVAMVIFVSSMSLITTVTAAMTENTRHSQGISVATDQNRLAFQRLDKQVRYADTITKPETNLAGTWRYVEIRMEELKYDCRGEGGPGCAPAARKWRVCSQWRYGSDNGLAPRSLETRTWRLNEVTLGPLTPGAPPNFRTVATGFVSDLDSAFTAPFTTGQRLQQLTVDIGNSRYKRGSQRLGVAQLSATFFARNSATATAAATAPIAGSLSVCHRTGLRP